MFTAFWIYWLQWTFMGFTLLYRTPELIVTLPMYIPSPDSDAFIIRWGFFNPSLLTTVNVYSALLPLLTSDRQVYWLQWTLLFTELTTQNATDYSECWSDAVAKLSTATAVIAWKSVYECIHRAFAWSITSPDETQVLLTTVNVWSLQGCLLRSPLSCSLYLVCLMIF